jgi:hypothetical protein
MSRIAGAVLLGALALVPTAQSGEVQRSTAGRTGFARQSPSLHRAQARRPLRLRETCVTRDERRGVLRFKASDGARLIGVVLGRGPRTVILAQPGGRPAGSLRLGALRPHARSRRLPVSSSTIEASVPRATPLARRE